MKISGKFFFTHLSVCEGEKYNVWVRERERMRVCVCSHYILLWHVEHRENKVRYVVRALTHAPL